MAVDPTDPATWPTPTIVVRCGNVQGVQELADRLSRDGSWSVFTGPGVSLWELALLSEQQNQADDGRGDCAAGGSLRASPGPPHHHDLSGLTAQQFDAILSLPEPNPVPKADRWMPS
jgi:hypothetical protein